MEEQLDENEEQLTEDEEQNQPTEDKKNKGINRFLINGTRRTIHQIKLLVIRMSK